MKILFRHIDILCKLHVLLCNEKYIHDHVFNSASYTNVSIKRGVCKVIRTSFVIIDVFVQRETGVE
jgi:hypothetical protein